MPKVSKNKVHTALDVVIANQLLESLKNIRSAKEAREFFDDLFTFTEKKMLQKRLAIGLLLELGASYTEISRMLKVSHATINRVANALSLGGGAYRKANENIVEALGRYRAKEKKKGSNSILDELFEMVGDFFIRWDDAKRHLPRLTRGR